MTATYYPDSHTSLNPTLRERFCDVTKIGPEAPNLNLPTVEVDGYTVPILDRPYSQILAAIEGGGELDMDTWHNMYFCGSCHCIAGWITHLCGRQGRALELAIGGFDEATMCAARMILEQSSSLKVPPFMPREYCLGKSGEAQDLRLVNARALDTIRALAAQEAA